LVVKQEKIDQSINLCLRQWFLWCRRMWSPVLGLIWSSCWFFGNNLLDRVLLLLLRFFAESFLVVRFDFRCWWLLTKFLRESGNRLGIPDDDLGFVAKFAGLRCTWNNSGDLVWLDVIILSKLSVGFFGAKKSPITSVVVFIVGWVCCRRNFAPNWRKASMAVRSSVLMYWKQVRFLAYLRGSMNRPCRLKPR